MVHMVRMVPMAPPFRRPSSVLLPVALALGALAALAAAAPVAGQARAASAAPTLEEFLSPGFPYDLVSAAGADRIAWIEYEKGARNVYTAIPPDYRPVRLTDNAEDDGVDLSGLQISDDGGVVTFIRGHAPNRQGWVANPTSEPRGARRIVHAVSTDGGAPWPVAEVRGYVLSPDGRWILHARDGQIHRAAVDPGAGAGGPAGAAGAAGADADEPLFRAWGENSDPVWSPDGSRIAFRSDREDHAYIGVYEVEDPSITYLAPGVDRDGSPAWSPDGTRIAFVRRPGLPFGARAEQPDEPPPGGWPEGLLEAAFRGGHDLELWMADVETGEGERIWHNQAADSSFASIRRLTWADNRHLVFEAEPANWRHWYSLSVDDPSAEPVELTPGEGFVEYHALSADGRYLYYATNVGDIDRRDLWRVPVSGGEAEQLTAGDGIETRPAVLASGEEVAVLHADATLPLVVAVVPSGGGEARRVVDLPAEFPRQAHVVPENVVIEAEDGLEFHNQLFLPPDLEPGERRPAVIFIHGGSRRQMFLGYHDRHFYHMAYGYNQYLANQGWVVLSVNYRSGIGYGREFRMAEDVGRRGNAEYRDILAAGLYLAERPDVDPERVGLWGLSYGGILTAQALARNSDVFAAGVDMAGVHLWGNTIDPEETSWRSSAIAAIEGWTSPVLLIHGDDDRNVAFSQTVGLVQLLRAHDVPYELIVFPDEVHDFLLFGRWMLAFEASTDFLERTLVRQEPIRTDGASGGTEATPLSPPSTSPPPRPPPPGRSPGPGRSGPWRSR